MGMHVAVIGGGFVGRVHLEAMLGHPAVSAVSLAEADAGALAELTGRYPLARTTTDYRALLDDPTARSRTLACPTTCTIRWPWRPSQRASTSSPTSPSPTPSPRPTR